MKRNVQSLWSAVDSCIGLLPDHRLAEVFRRKSFCPGEGYGPHNHRRIELNYVMAGSCSIFSGDSSFTFAKNDIMIIQSGAHHRFVAGAGGACLLQLEFMPEIAEMTVRSELTGIVSEQNVIKIKGNSEIISTIGILIRELEEKRHEYVRMTMLCYARLMLLISRQIHQAASEGGNEMISKSKAYIEDNYMGDISIEEVAVHCGITARYLRKLYSEHIGCSPAQYIRSVRLAHASDLLMTTGMSIKEISYKCGFRSPHYFSKLYKEATGVLPRIQLCSDS